MLVILKYIDKLFIEKIVSIFI